MMKIQEILSFVSILTVLMIICTAGCIGTTVGANTLLEKVAKTQQNTDCLAYVETLTMNIKNETRTIEYDVQVKMPDKFRIIERNGTMIQSEVVANGERIWIYNPKSNTVLVRNQTLSEKIPEPAIHTMITDTLTEKYIIDFDDTESLNSTPVRKIKLVPRESGSDGVTEYQLWIDSEHLIPVKLISFMRDTQALTLEYPEYSINCLTDDNEFTFTLPAGVHEVNL